MNDDSLKSRTWQGYLRSDGRKGIRNHVLVIYTVECASYVAHEIACNEENVHVIGFPGCYDNAYAIRLMLALATHPNVGACLAIGLGCEYTQPSRISEVAERSGRPSKWFFIQDVGGTRASIEHGKQIIARLRDQLKRETRRVPMTWSDLTVGAECGGSDGTSGLAGNPAVGRFYDLLVDQGGCAVFEEVVEMIGLRDILLSRARSPEVAAALDAAYKKAERYCKAVRQYSVSPGNFAGGLTTIEEKSMGAFAKSGTCPIEGVLLVSQQPSGPGLWLLDSVPDEHFMQFGYTNPNDTEGIMDLISTGAQIVLFVTGRGSVIGSAVAPLLKVTGNSNTFARMRGDMDFDAGRVLSGQISLDTAGRELMTLVGDVASGELTKPEALGHREYFVMYKHQNVPSLEAGCRA
ncbi:UxaA family hydrolase [Granulicella sp. L46]|uniref:UxaA family hydrolase n=1 Tax=Granulicella sp. L46 TaxID=1641865 RepID=UPI00131E6526|nr:UxaA family hydrolase [Granulicella sp. L46]